MDSMSVIVVCSIPATEFLLGEFFRRHPTAQASLERVVPLDSRPVPYIWLQGDEAELAALASVDAVDTVTVVDETEEGQLVKVEWDESPDQLVDVIADAGGTLLEGRVEREQWTLHLRFPDHDRLEHFHETCRSRNIDLLIDSVHEDESDNQSPSDGLTQEQAETVRVALERGYFEVPRQATLEDLADEFGISDTAVSQRLRRALGTLVHSSVGDTGKS
jgi:predicted DNA binding protein